MAEDSRSLKHVEIHDDEANSRLESDSDSSDGGLSSKSGDDGGESSQQWVKNKVKSNEFQFSVGGVIVINTVVMAMQADNPNWDYWWIPEYLLLGFFVVELTLRLYGYGCHKFFCKARGGENLWNIFDFTIVLLGAVDTFGFQLIFAQPKDQAGEHEDSHVSKFVTVLRVIRILRLLRLLRLFKTFPELFVLAVGLVESLKVVFWISILFFILIFVSAIFCTTMIGHESKMYKHPDEIEYYWGKVPDSMKTLFQFVTLDNWASIARMVTEKQPSMQFFFILYIILTAFTILSLLTGVVSEHILMVAKDQEEGMKARRDEELHQFMDDVKALFDAADVDGSRSISRTEFKRILKDKEWSKKLLAMGIEVYDFDFLELFDCLDLEGKEELSHDEFVNGFRGIRGEAKAKDLLKLQGAVSRMAQKIPRLNPAAVRPGDLSPNMKSFNGAMDKLEHSMAGMARQMDSLEEQFHDFMSFMGKAPVVVSDDEEEESSIGGSEFTNGGR